MSRIRFVSPSAPMVGSWLGAAFILGGCVDHYHEHRRVIVEEPGPVVAAPAPVVVEPPVVEEYYFSAGHYYYWHPTYNRYVIVDHVPPGRRVVRVERLPERIPQRANVNAPPPERHREHE